MKTITTVFTAVLLLSFCLSAQELKPKAQAKTPRGSWTTLHSRLYEEGNQYIVFKLWNEAEPITDKEKTELQNLKKQLAGKNAEVIEYQYKSKEDLEKLFKDKGIEDVEVSTENGISLKCKNSNYNTSSSKAIFIFEGKSPEVAKRPIILSVGERSEDNVKVFFKLRSFS
jgi:hypothetical protein